jgi:hypothetical protein
MSCKNPRRKAVFGGYRYSWERSEEAWEEGTNETKEDRMK